MCYEIQPTKAASIWRVWWMLMSSPGCDYLKFASVKACTDSK